MAALTLQVKETPDLTPLFGIDPGREESDTVVVMTTPPIDEDYWIFRVAVSDDQAVVGFMKFGVVGVGFQHEDADWNTNLPSDCDAERIYEHCKANSRGADRKTCIAAIRLIQQAVQRMDKGRRRAP